MRASLNRLVLGVTGLVVVAFVLPLAVLVSRQADQRGRLEAERTAQALAAVVVRVVATTGGELEATSLERAIGEIPPKAALILPAGEILGATPIDRDLVAAITRDRSSRSGYIDTGFAVGVPILTRSGMVVVYSSVSTETLRHGVARAWTWLGLLAAVLMAAGMVVAAQLGRSVLEPSQALAEAAERLGRGDLSTRVETIGPPELMAIAEAFNSLADRIRFLLDAEREQVADLSHRLRTPLTALRLQTEQLEDGEERTILLNKVDRLGAAIDELINQARRRPVEGPAQCLLDETARKRLDFWQVLAEEQQRDVKVSLGAFGRRVGVAETEMAAAIDAMVGNVFSHTGPEVGFSVLTVSWEDRVELIVEDDGPGFPIGLEAADRGVSGGGSTGLGLDIVGRLASRLGGEMLLEEGASGGARVRVILPSVNAPTQERAPS